MPFTMSGINLQGWKPQRPDHRDKLYVPASISYGAGEPPEKVDLSTDIMHTPRVENQGHLGSCVGHAVTSAMEYTLNKGKRYHLEYSRMFVWYYARMFQGWQDKNEGCYIRDAFKAIAMYGCPIEDLWPYDQNNMAVEPDKTAQENAKLNKLSSYMLCQGLSGVKDALAEGYPVAGGFSVPESISSRDTCNTGVVTYPEKNERVIGGHAVLFVGYDDEHGLLKFENSWGLAWGEMGFGYLPYEYLMDGLACDFWATIK